MDFSRLPGLYGQCELAISYIGGQGAMTKMTGMTVFWEKGRPQEAYDRNDGYDGFLGKRSGGARPKWSELVLGSSR